MNPFLSGRLRTGMAVVFCCFVLAMVQSPNLVAQQIQVRIKHKSSPAYPPIAIQAHIMGEVKLAAEIDSAGNVQSVHASGDHPLLCKFAEDSLRGWKFGPFRDDQRFPVIYNVVFSYRLTGSPVAGFKPSKVIWKLPGRVEIIARPPELRTTQ
jgi:hypothetical protein